MNMLMLQLQDQKSILLNKFITFLKQMDNLSIPKLNPNNILEYTIRNEVSLWEHF